MARKNRQLAVGLMSLAFQPVGKQQVGGQRDQPSQPFWIPQGQLHSDGSALGKPGKNNAFWWNTPVNLPADQRRCLVDTFHDAAPIMITAGLHTEDVVPGTHRHATVKGNRPDRCMRKHETDIRERRAMKVAAPVARNRARPHPGHAAR